VCICGVSLVYHCVSSNIDAVSSGSEFRSHTGPCERNERLQALHLFAHLKLSLGQSNRVAKGFERDAALHDICTPHMFANLKPRTQQPSCKKVWMTQSYTTHAYLHISSLKRSICVAVQFERRNLTPHLHHHMQATNSETTATQQRSCCHPQAAVAGQVRCSVRSRLKTFPLRLPKRN